MTVPIRPIGRLQNSRRNRGPERNSTASRVVGKDKMNISAIEFGGGFRESSESEFQAKSKTERQTESTTQYR